MKNNNIIIQDLNQHNIIQFPIITTCGTGYSKTEVFETVQVLGRLPNDQLVEVNCN